MSVWRDENSDSLEVQNHGGGFNFEIDNPWAGDSETGFGRTTHFRMTPDKALELASWLIAEVARTTGKESGE